MREEAIAEIYGTLSSDLMIEEVEDGRKYGLTTVAVRKEIEAQANSSLVDKTRYFPIARWNQELLSTEGHLLRRGIKVLIIGELDIFNPALDNSSNHETDDLFHGGTMLVNVRRSAGIMILSKPGETEEILSLNDSLRPSFVGFSQGKLELE